MDDARDSNISQAEKFPRLRPGECGPVRWFKSRERNPAKLTLPISSADPPRRRARPKPRTRRVAPSRRLNGEKNGHEIDGQRKNTACGFSQGRWSRRFLLIRPDEADWL